MHLPEFALLALATVSAVAFGWGAAMLALLEPKYGITKGLFWIGALTFWSLGIVFSATSDQTLWVQLTVSGLVGAVAAIGLSWGLWEIRSHEQKSHNPTADEEVLPRKSTLEATRDSTIDATGSVIPGDLPFQFARADDHSLISMAGVIVTKQHDGSLAIASGSANISFPPPTGEYSSLSSSGLKFHAKEISDKLIDLQHRRDAEFRKLMSDGNGKSEPEKWRSVNEPFFTEYSTKLWPDASSITREFVSRLGSVAPPSAETESGLQIQSGAQMILHKAFAGPRPASDAAAFLNYLCTKLP